MNRDKKLIELAVVELIYNGDYNTDYYVNKLMQSEAYQKFLADNEPSVPVSNERALVIQECVDQLLKQLQPVRQQNGYPDMAVGKATILMLPALMGEKPFEQYIPVSKIREAIKQRKQVTAWYQEKDRVLDEVIDTLENLLK